MAMINGLGNPLLDSIYFNSIFNVGDVQLCDWTSGDRSDSQKIAFDVPVVIGERYTMNPFGMIFNNTTLRLLDVNKNAISSDITFIRDSSITITSCREVVIERYNTVNNARDHIPNTVLPQTVKTESDIAYIWVRNLLEPSSQDTSKWNPNEGWGMTLAKYASESYVPKYYPHVVVRENLEGYWDQFREKITELFEAPDIHSVRAEAIRKLNESRDCIRVGTFNGQVMGELKPKLDAIKNMFADYGLDFVGMQEVKNEHSGVANNYPTHLVSKTLPFVDNTVSIDDVTPWMENVILSRYEIVSAEKVEYKNLGGESRGYVKTVIKLPRYKDYFPDGDQYLSLYCTHLDMYINRALQMEELRDAMLSDTNRFIVAVMDSNDFTATKDSWKILTNAGFTQIHDGTSKTEATDGTFTASSSIDQIFCNSNMSVEGYDIISPYKYTDANGNVLVSSDHDLVFADLKLDYGDISYPPTNPQVVPSTYYHITRNMNHVKDSLVATNLAPNWHYQSTLTADDGYTISSVTVTMGEVDITASAYSNGTLDFTVTGDVVIAAVAT